MSNRTGHSIWGKTMQGCWPKAKMVTNEGFSSIYFITLLNSLQQENRCLVWPVMLCGEILPRARMRSTRPCTFRFNSLNTTYIWFRKTVHREDLLLSCVCWWRKDKKNFGLISTVRNAKSTGTYFMVGHQRSLGYSSVQAFISRSLVTYKPRVYDRERFL